VSLRPSVVSTDPTLVSPALLVVSPGEVLVSTRLSLVSPSRALVSTAPAVVSPSPVFVSPRLLVVPTNSSRRPGSPTVVSLPARCGEGGLGAIQRRAAPAARRWGGRFRGAAAYTSS